MTYAIQFISAPALLRAQGRDVRWEWHYDISGVDYTSYASVEEATRQLELDADGGAYRYRIVEVASVDQSYDAIPDENIDALDALTNWCLAGCPLTSEHIEAMRRAARACVDAAPVTVVHRATNRNDNPGEEREAS